MKDVLLYLITKEMGGLHQISRPLWRRGATRSESRNDDRASKNFVKV